MKDFDYFIIELSDDNVELLKKKGAHPPERVAVGICGGQCLGYFKEYEEAIDCAKNHMEETQHWSDLWRISDSGSTQVKIERGG